MEKILKNIIVFTIFLIIMFNIVGVCSATNIITNENLISAFQKFETSEQNEKKYKIGLDSNVITIETTTGEKYNMNYMLSEKITFKLEMQVKDGMSYNDFKRQTNNLILPMIGYLAVANIQGVEYKDAHKYISSYLGEDFNGTFSKNNAYIVVDDSNEQNNIIDNTEVSIINASEFGSKVMEYVGKVYENKQTINDMDKINSFDWSIEKEDLQNSTSSCKLISTLTVNLDADFSKLKNNYNSQNNTQVTNIISNNNNGTLTQVQNTDVDNTTSNNVLPAVGKQIIINVICLISLIILIITTIKFKYYKGI